MGKKLFAFISIYLFLAIFGLSLAPAGASTREQTLMEEVWLNPARLEGGQGQDTVVSSRGLEASGSAAVYTTAVITAPLPFNAAVARWEAVVPQGSSLSLSLRTGDENGWSEWHALERDADLSLPGEEITTGPMIFVDGASVTNDRVQLQVVMSLSPAGETPRLEGVGLAFIDSTAGPTTAELLARQQMQPETEQTAAGYPKPPVISRDVWCLDPACDYTDGIYYYPVSHLILHHTVTSGDGDSAAIVRAIWKYHTFSREWGDIGYNYLVDINGNIFEGHLGGDNVIGTHAAGANKGSMALSMIGNFEEINPTPAMVESAIQLFSWKADQQQIDVYDASGMPDLDWGVPNFMGHRDVYGTTACPGTNAHVLLPAMRDEIARRIGFTPPHIYYDEWTPQTNFSRSSIYWWDGPSRCGFNGHAYYTWSVEDPADSTNWAEWRPEIPVSGRYELSVYAPRCYTKEPDTEGAVYQITHANGQDVVVVNQEANLGLWVPLGTYEFNAGHEGRLRLTDLTSTDSDAGVWFDAIRLRPVEVPALPEMAGQQPASDSWLSQRAVTFSWDVIHPEALTGQSLQIATDSSFDNLLLEQTLAAGDRTFSHTFTDDYPALYWRLLFRLSTGDQVPSAVTRFGIDTLPPTSAIGPLYRYQDGHFLVTWKGEDAGSGILGYNIEYREGGTTTWTAWQTGTAATWAVFIPPHPDRTYWFRSQAYDYQGFIQTIAGDSEANTEQAFLLSHIHTLPIIVR